MNESPANVDVRLSHVTKRYGHVAAVHDLSMEVRRGEFVSLLGPSGCGKTTTLRILAGFAKPTSGEVEIAGKSMNATPPYRRPVNMVFQHYALFPHMTVWDNVAYGPRRKGMPRQAIAEAVAEALKLVNLGDVGDRHPHQLSGGQQQRVALARALINRPRVLLLDEPLGALDLKLRRQMQIELKRLQDYLGITFIYVTHDQEEALVLSDRVAVMNAGRIEQMDDARLVYEQPATTFVADFIGQTNLLACTVEGVQGSRLAVRCEGLRFLASGDEATPTGNEIRISLRPERIGIGTDRLVVGNCFRATVTQRVYLGVLTTFQVLLEQKLSLVVTTSDQQLAQKVNPNAQVWVGWKAGDERIVQG